jgi:hypothetical protein
LSDADKDAAAKEALWREICEAAVQLASHCIVSSSALNAPPGRLDPKQPVPDVPTWKLVEALSLLSILLRAGRVRAGLVNIFGKLGPLEIEEDGLARYVWAQPNLRGDYSDLGGRPDLVVTSSSDPPTPSNVLRVIEVKCSKQLGAQIVRAEFGKAHDLRVATYLIWTFYAASTRVKDGARGLGLDLVELGFDIPRGEDLIRQPGALLSHVAHVQEQARRSSSFLRALEDAGQEARRKLPLPSR